MIEVKGKYNTAKVFTDDIENTAVGQVMELCNQEFVKDSQIRIMPDVHAGVGCTIGTTMTITDKIVPNLVGVDIGCGMSAVKIKGEPNLERLDEVIRTNIPSGRDINEHATINSDRIDLSELYYFSKYKAQKAASEIDRAYCSAGSLGSGNHFIECDKDKNGDIWLVVHSGSRHLGVSIATFYQDMAYKMFAGIPKSASAYIGRKMQKLPKEKRTAETAAALAKAFKLPDVEMPPKQLCYLKDYFMGWDLSAFSDYIHDMRITQKFAAINRSVIVQKICGSMKWEIVDGVETIHNYIDVDHMILRKGSVSARAGERLIIPMNMRDGSLICVGRGNQDWNFSAPHGAGRLMSRSRAKSDCSLEEYRQSMDGVYTTSVSEATIDECPQAYKPMDEIIGNIKDTVDIIDVIKPVYNFKAGE